MLKIRVMGDKEELERFKGYLTKEQDCYEVDNLSGMYQNKGTDRHHRMYAELTRNSEKKEKENE